MMSPQASSFGRETHECSNHRDQDPGFEDEQLAVATSSAVSAIRARSAAASARSPSPMTRRRSARSRTSGETPRVTTEVLVERGAQPADGSGRGCVVFLATVNLEAALRHVRSRWAAHRDAPADGRTGFLLWADAVCINQADTGERSRQVEMMRRIFSSADLVLAWLGPRDLSLAFGALETIASARESSPVVEDFLGLRWLRSRPDPCEETDTWRQILAFLRLPYWTRIWVF
ncbi:heterokaryon incompatibility protein-domain-containing protein [Colletotrichum cereale]|nr:heterokaryon incompatibility protein-domain-containing protein [Colletotrichum cereale]